MIKFKTERIEKEFNSPELSNDLRSRLYILSFYCKLEFKKDITITGIFRYGFEQYNIYKNYESFQNKPWKSVHEFWKGADVRSWTFTEKQKQKIVIFMNMITYSTKYKTCTYHDVGKGKHFHIQSKG